MMSGSYANLLDPPPVTSRRSTAAVWGSAPHRRLSPVMIVAGTLTELVDRTNSVTSNVPSSIAQDRIIIVANQLPVRSKSRGWDEDSLLLQLKDGPSRRHHRSVFRRNRARGQELLLHPRLVSSVGVLSIVGMGGIGKVTSLRAVHMEI